MHRFPRDKAKRAQWMEAVGLADSDILGHTRICSRHFLHGDTTSPPSISLGKRFASPKKLQLDRGKRALKRESMSPPFQPPASKRPAITSPGSCSSSSQPETPVHVLSDTTEDSDRMSEALSATIGEPLLSDYSVHELPGERASDPVVDLALSTRIELLEAENRQLRAELSSRKSKPFQIEDIAPDDSLVRFYTGFVSYEVLLAFFEFLGPSVHNLTYWGSSNTRSGLRRRKKLNPINQLFLTLVKLRLNLRVKDLAWRFGISVGLVSKYITTWICFLYQHLKEIEWMPTVKQVAATLPVAFKQEYPATFAIVDASELFLETPSDLQMQSSTWSNYKHHNTAKFLVACTPNGSISYVSPLFVGSISDVELTRVCGLLEKLKGKSGVSIMADRGFTVQDQLQSIGIKLNVPPFMEGRQQLPAEEVQEGRKIASLRIHVERAIGRIKNFSILKGTLPLSMARLANQIVCVCAWLTNFQPALVPLPEHEAAESEDEVVDYFQSLYGSDSDTDTEESEEEF